MKNDVEMLSKKALLDRNVSIDVTVTLTSIYDNSLHNVFSNLFPFIYSKSTALSLLLQNYSINCPCLDSFLIHIPTRLHIASTKGTASSYSFCKEAFNFFIDVYSTYSTVELTKGKTLIECDNGTNVYIKVVSTHLCLALLLPKESIKDIAIYDYNFTIFKQGVEELLRIK
ncbi:GTP-binding protein [Entamoeba marina]